MRCGKRVLIVVDVQNDFCPGGALQIKDGDSIIPLINRIMERFDLVVATQDWHPQNQVSFASNNPGKIYTIRSILAELLRPSGPIIAYRGRRGLNFMTT